MTARPAYHERLLAGKNDHPGRQAEKKTTQPAHTPSHQEELNHRHSVERWLGRQLRLVEIQD
jgi:hypothetical protein